MNLLESYAKRLNVSESVYSKAHDGESLSNEKKIAVARVLDNTSKFLNEAFTNSTGTQRADLGMYKKFALNLTTVALPNLIAHDLVIVQPMSSMSGYINYLEYTAGSNKGTTTQGTVLNSPFGLGAVDSAYTSKSVVETFVGDASTKSFTLAWTPVAKVGKVLVDDVETEFTVEGAVVTIETAPAKDSKVRIAYEYDNEVIPQNDIPTINVRVAAKPLIAKARRVAIYYSQIAAFQAKTDYGFDLGDQLAEKAIGQLSYEIDTEVTDLLIANASEESTLEWSRTIPNAVSKAEHYEGFAEVVEIAKQIIYDRTKRFAPNYMLIASNILPILVFIKGFKAADTKSINGPYFAGTLNGVKVFVTPNIEAGKFVLGVNGDDLMSSAAVYAPYMAVVPTQLLGYADGGNSQGFSTLYALEMLNANLLVSGKVVA